MIESSKLGQIDQNTIESIEVIKNSEKNKYVAQYGENAKNAVILVTTKKK